MFTVFSGGGSSAVPAGGAGKKVPPANHPRRGQKSSIRETDARAAGCKKRDPLTPRAGLRCNEGRGCEKRAGKLQSARATVIVSV
jgi:hypothetical protein